jgi:hypothetical protein
MPVFHLRSWATQTLYDEQDYAVEAETLDAAKELLANLQDQVQCGDPISAGVQHDRVTARWGGNKVTMLDPEEITDTDGGLIELDAAFVSALDRYVRPGESE